MNKRRYMRLMPSESVIIRAAADIYSGYLASGRVQEGQEADYLKRSIIDAIRIADTVDEQIQSDDEVQ